MLTFQFTTDSGADLPLELIEKWDILVVSLFVRFGDEQFKSTDFTTQAFLERIDKEKTFPQSAAPSPLDFYQTFKAIDPNVPIVHISISSGVSASFNHAVMARTQLLEEEPDRLIYIIDSKTASSGMFLLFTEAVKLRQEQFSAKEIYLQLLKRIPYLRTIVLLETLDNLIRGGRLSRAKGAIAKTLNVQLILHASAEGKLDVLEKIRGLKKAQRRFQDIASDYISDQKERVLVMTHGYAKDKCDAIIEKVIENNPFNQVYQSETGLAISAHAGRGSLVMAFFGDLTHSEKK